MATEDNAVILNPYSTLSEAQKQAVVKNEKSRIYMRTSGVKPKFNITDEQKKLFAEYGSEQDIRETIAARILSGDSSAGDITDEQVKWVGDNLTSREREKGLGYFGELKRPDGMVSTELSIGVEFDGKETEIPSLVPTLTKDEINHLLAGNEPTEQIVDKAVVHAKERMAEGKSPFAQEGEQVSLEPPEKPEARDGKI